MIQAHVGSNNNTKSQVPTILSSASHKHTHKQALTQNDCAMSASIRSNYRAIENSVKEHRTKGKMGTATKQMLGGKGAA